MRGSVQVIKFTTLCSILSGIITYFISINTETGWIILNSPYISSSFALTLSSGVLTGFLVALLCESQKYINTKHAAEDNIFFQTLYLYQQLFWMQRIMSELLEHPDANIPKGLLQDGSRKAACLRNAVQVIDYCTIFPISTMASRHIEFCTNTLCQVDKILSDGMYLDLAILLAERNFLGCNQPISMVTSAVCPVHQTLIQLQKEFTDVMQSVGNYLYIVDEECDTRYHWSEIKEKMQDSYTSVFEMETLSDFLRGKD